MGQVLSTTLGNQQPGDGTTMHYKFTGKERDSESGLDTFGARYYGSNVGRWISADWAHATYYTDAHGTSSTCPTHRSLLVLLLYFPRYPQLARQPIRDTTCRDGRHHKTAAAHPSPLAWADEQCGF